MVPALELDSPVAAVAHPVDRRMTCVVLMGVALRKDQFVVGIKETVMRRCVVLMD
jgi:hypothetical protein